MIRGVLLPRLEEAFPGAFTRKDGSDELIAVFPAAHEEVGEVSVWDDGWEATVSIGTITHLHFNPYDPSLSEVEVAKVVSDEVIDFLRALFADEVLLWKSSDGRSGGSRMLSAQGLTDTPGACDRRYLWSGPLPGTQGGRAS
jgi:hypothetical protein